MVKVAKAQGNITGIIVTDPAQGRAAHAHSVALRRVCRCINSAVRLVKGWILSVVSELRFIARGFFSQIKYFLEL